MDKRILAALIAAMASTAYAQSGSDAAKPAPAPGYLVNSASAPALNSARHCVHTGSWSPSLAAEPCDVVPRA
ncbi:MAG TPA: hypothetical protein VFI86_04460, partial [Burkholderiales bacterium]|nr:hypothetical protein [Burkholderiales bacterium]